MSMHNQEIIKRLTEALDNAVAVKAHLQLWDESESFPSDFDTLKVCIKMNKWFYNDFDYEMELLVKKYLPDYMLDVFFDMKEFKSNSRNELTSSCRLISKTRGYPMETQDDKAFCQYDYSLRKYFEHSIINQGNKL